MDKGPCGSKCEYITEDFIEGVQIKSQKSNKNCRETILSIPLTQVFYIFRKKKKKEKKKQKIDWNKKY